MDIAKYKQLREEIKNKSFEKKYTGVDWILYYSSFFGNIASIFFAFFLWFPSLLKTITLHVADNSFTYGVAIFTTIILLGLVEFLKRGVLGIFSSEFIESNYKFSNKSVVGLFMFSSAILALSFYFSINGAIEFSKTSGKANIEVEETSKSLIDSLVQIGEQSKIPINEELSSLRESNKGLRQKRDDTPINYKSTRESYNNLIKDNEAQIESNVKKLDDINIYFKKKIVEQKTEEINIKNENTVKDESNVFLFLIVSSFIEVLIVIGVYFRQLYIHRSFYESELKLEPIIKKQEKYETLLKLVFKNGEIKQDEKIISLNKLTDILKNKGGNYTPKHVKDFYNEITHLGVIELISNKRFARVSYEEAKKQLESLENL